MFADHHQGALGKSPELERLYTYVGRKEAELERSPAPSAMPKKKTGSSRNTATQAEHELEEDRRAIAELVRQQTSYVKMALRMYAGALMLSNEYDDSTTRLCSLWLQHDDSEEINKAFAGALDRVPSHKFIFLGPQLAAKLDRPKTPTAFNTALNSLVLRISRQHPYHILYQIITLASGMSLPSTSRRMSDSGAEGRGPAALGILATLAADNGNSVARDAASQMNRFAEASISWCHYKEPNRDAGSFSGRDIKLPSNCKLGTLQGLKIPIATLPPPIDLVYKYASVPTLHRYRSKYSVLGGLHKPKKMEVVDSQGKIYSQLVSAVRHRASPCS